MNVIINKKIAVVGGHLELLKWAREHDCPWDEMTRHHADLNGNLELLQWAVEHGAPAMPPSVRLAKHRLVGGNSDAASGSSWVRAATAIPCAGGGIGRSTRPTVVPSSAAAARAVPDWREGPAV
jgi:hypothetical protein